MFEQRNSDEPCGMNSEWQQASLMLKELTEMLSAWAAVVLIPKSSEALHCAAYYRLPKDWAALENRLDSGSMNARAYLSQKKLSTTIRKLPNLQQIKK